MWLGKPITARRQLMFQTKKTDMKKLMFSVLLVFACSATFAQVQFALGLKAGPNFAAINTDGSAGENYKGRTGFHGGAFVLIKATKIGIQPEFIYSKQGAKFEFNSQDYESNYDYFNIPIIVKLYLAAGLNLQVGPQFGFLTSVSGKQVASVGTTQIAVDMAKEEYKSSDLSAAFGLGWDLPFGLTLDARYNLGLSKIQDNPDFDNTKNQVFQFSVGYKLFKVGE
jgi:hypothetical protein